MDLTGDLEMVPGMGASSFIKLMPGDGGIGARRCDNGGRRSSNGSLDATAMSRSARDRPPIGEWLSKAAKDGPIGENSSRWPPGVSIPKLGVSYIPMLGVPTPPQSGDRLYFYRRKEERKKEAG